jgi:ribose/xylose/arabinose/galactoside ABC-type transport system permease subunit
MTAALQNATRAVPIRRWKSVFESYGQELVILAVVVVLFIGVGLYNPRFMSVNNLTSIFVGNAYIAIAAIGMSLVIISGNIDVSVGSLIGVLGTISGTMAVSGYPILLCWLVPIAIGMVINAGVGVLVAYVKIPSIVVTLGMLSILKGGLISVTGGAWISGMPPGFMIAQFRFFGIPSSVYFMVILTVLAALWMKYSVFGRTIYAIGGNPEAARVSGIRIQPSIVGVFTIHGMFAGIAAVLFATQLQVIQSTVPPNLELTVITASVVGGVSILGGTGTVIGSTFAAILFAAIGSSLVFLNVSAYWLRAVQGLMILATVLADMARRRRI